jgi:hypothetical protein
MAAGILHAATYAYLFPMLFASIIATSDKDFVVLSGRDLWSEVILKRKSQMSRLPSRSLYQGA